ncbi:MAG: hypothetical protein RIT43_1055 [Bacteroidota bacterium]|jgi:hypothetical protein
MRNTFLICFFLFIALKSNAQQGAGIYKMHWFVDQRLTNRFTIGANGGNQLTIPQHLYDSITSEVQKIVQSELHTNVQWLYSLNKKGQERRYPATSQQVGGLPRGTKRQAMATEYLEYYVKVKISVDVHNIGSIGTEVVSYSRLKPFVKIKMKAYGIDRRRKYRKVARTSNFKSIGSFQYNLGGVTMTNNNALPIEQIVKMVGEGLEKFKNKPR